jgi:sugar lactone lactonase YvrE
VSDAEVTCALPCAALLGEGAVWSVRDQALWWVDINAPSLHRFDPATGRDEAWIMPESIGCLALGPAHRVLVGLASGLAWFDPQAHQLEHDARIEADVPTSRLNDGRCDRQGRLWVGSMNRGVPGVHGSLYRCEAGAAPRAMLTGIQVPNTTAFSPDGRIMYFADSPSRCIRAFDLDPATGDISGERIFATVDTGVPDGATVDAEGGLWVACWDGWRVLRFRPDGGLDREIAMPVPRPTCCAFGGPDLATLYVTSARNGLDADMLDRAPLSGGVFALRPGVRGVAEPVFGGDIAVDDPGPNG